MRYYLDTNILIFLLSGTDDNINTHILKELKDLSNTLLISSMVLQELLFLFRIGKLRLKRYKSENDIVSELNNLDIKIIFFNKYHFEQYKNLTIAPNHKDMNDHAILAQAISDKITLISSDNDFKKYTAQGLSFLYNQR